MTSSSSSHHLDASSTTSTPRAGASSSSSNGNGNGNGNGGHYHHHHPPPHAPSSQAQAHAGPTVRLMLSFGGRILPRPGDQRLRYVGGETRIVSVPRTASHAVLTAALARLAPALFASSSSPTLRYQLPQDDLDSLISVSSDDDVDNLMDELDHVHGLAATALKQPRLRLFLFAASTDHFSSAAAFGSVLSGTGDGSTDKWFVDQLNAPAPSSLERARSEASSIVSDNMDGLFIDTTSDEPSPDPAADADAQPKSDTETAPDDDDKDKPAPVQLSAPLAPYVAETAPWPAPPPQYMQHPVYFVPAPPVHYLDAAGRQGGYMPGPVYHMVGPRGNQVQGDLYASGSVGSMYGVPHSMPPFRQVIYAPTLAPADDHSAEEKPKEGGSHSP